MRVVLAPNALKGSLSSPEAARVMAAAASAAAPGASCVPVPVADGGDGLVDVLHGILGGRLEVAEVADPLGRRIRAAWLLLPDGRTAVIEMARASGLALLADGERDPGAASSSGTGELVRAALDAGARRILLGLGGSATNDGGTGIAAALGARFLDGEGRALAPCGASLSRVRRVDLSGLDARLASARVEGITDVDNPLLGECGAARVYGPQKGAGPAQALELDRGLGVLAEAVRRDLGRDVAGQPGAGAAGGAGAGLVAFLGGRLLPGAEAVLDLAGLDRHLADADLVITAEGSLDAQSASGKAPVAVARAARRRGVPCFALAGRLEGDREALCKLGFSAMFPLCPGPVSLEESMRQAGPFLAAATAEAVRAFLAGRGIV